MLLKYISSNLYRIAFLMVTALLFTVTTKAQKTIPNQENNTDIKVVSAKKINSTTFELLFNNQNRLSFDFYGENIFRVFQDNNGGIIRAPEATPSAQILVNNPRKNVDHLNLIEKDNQLIISTAKVVILINKDNGLIRVLNKATSLVVVDFLKPISFENNKVSLSLKENEGEYFYGGGVQNGRFSHKGKVIAIENQNSWTDGGVASPNPFFWSTKGYGMLFYTFKKGRYDFGATEKGLVKLYHETSYLDAFLMVDEQPANLLKDFYQLTGNPILLPKFGFYQGHQNAYNRDYWMPDEKGILFEDGKRYKESQKDNGGIKESLNGEKNNYQFSARAVIDRYKNNDMPFGWILPNDGYGAGYGQTESLDGNIQNLKNLGDYAHENGVQIGLWTQSDLFPKPEISALLQRDIVKEVRDAGVRVLKTDVAWVGAGYSFGLNGVASASQIMSYYGKNSRPFIISLDGWAGTQRYATIWSGDQTGGNWEYIRFHIPTYLGSGLSGQPNITSDMDGIFGGRNDVVNTRDFQWKTFTPMQLNMDGWGTNEKYPHALGEPTTSINRNYLKLKSELLPYSYSIAKDAVNGWPIMRAMFLAYPSNFTFGKATQYQFLYGPNFLIAPIYEATNIDKNRNDIRNGIYLPEGSWIDYFSGDKYDGGRVINNFNVPIWKLPVFVKNGAIVPMVNANNNVNEINQTERIYEIYPFGKSEFTEYDDDGKTEDYKLGKGTTTLIKAVVNANNSVNIEIQPTKGGFDGFVKNKSTVFKINVTQHPVSISAKIGRKLISLIEVKSKIEFAKKSNVYFYDTQPSLNNFATKGSEFEKVAIVKNPQVLVKLAATDITVNSVLLTITGFKFESSDKNRLSTGILNAPKYAEVKALDREAYSLKPSWQKTKNADYYDIEFNNMLYSTIKDTALIFDGLNPETDYSFKIRAVNKVGSSTWANFSARTKNNPLEFAIKDITAETTVKNQDGEGLEQLLDFDEATMWHTAYGAKAVPFDLVIDLKSIYQLDKFNYLPRSGRGNGVILMGTVSYSNNKENWTEAGAFTWERSDKIKIFDFKNKPSSRYIKLAITSAVGDYGSGRELYVFKVPETESYLPGDLNNDKKIDRNDLTSYTNYNGLKKGDADFEGYISKGDMNANNLIDAYDISVVATQIDGGIKSKTVEKVAGMLEITAPKDIYTKNEIVELIVKGEGLNEVNALSFALPYSMQDYEFVDIKPLNVKQMENLTYDRLHTDGSKILYPTFVNIGNKDALNGSVNLFVIRLKAKRNVKFNLKLTKGLLVDKNLNTVVF